MYPGVRDQLRDQLPGVSLSLESARWQMGRISSKREKKIRNRLVSQEEMVVLLDLGFSYSWASDANFSSLQMVLACVFLRGVSADNWTFIGKVPP